MARLNWVGLVVAALLACLLVPEQRAFADGKRHKLRIATVAPDGTSWANTFHKFAAELDKETGGDVELKFYFGGIAGTEDEVFKLLQAGKLDGAISGGPICRKVAPSMRVLDVVGLFQKQDEANYVVNELRPALDREAHDAGYALLATGSLGPIIMFSREPITSMAELQKAKLWSWDLQEVFLKEAAELKIPTLGMSLTDAAKAFDAKRTDGYLTTPVAALAFQWYVGTKYITDLRTGYLMGCFVMRETAIDALRADHQASLRKGAAKTGVKIDVDSRRTDEKLLGGTYEKLGVKFVPVSKKFRAEFFEASRLARQRLGEALVPRALLDKVTQLLADYRAEHD
ncbi:MAG TPA: TRAP transporter substrate-binding protein DctP [Kofleriaceae bacterium]|jgi:TRAP-type C4-dicarboxylate transport system substrate-binding protein